LEIWVHFVTAIDPLTLPDIPATNRISSSCLIFVGTVRLGFKFDWTTREKNKAHSG
jgi:hypothetical protein